MIQKGPSETQQRLKYVACDWVMSFIAFALFNLYRYRFTEVTVPLGQYLMSTKLVTEQLILPTVMLGIYWLSGYYNIPFNKSRLQEIVTTFFSACINTTGIFMLMLLNDVKVRRTDNYIMLLVLLTLLFLFTYAGRATVTSIAIRMFKRHHWVRRTIIVGNSAFAHKTAGSLNSAQSRYGYSIIGFVPLDGENDMDSGFDVYNLESLPEICREKHVDQVVIAPERYNEETELKLLYRLFSLQIPIKIAPDTLSFVTSGIHLQDIYGDPFVDLSTPRISDSAKNIKRFADVVFSVIALIFLSPLFLAIAIANRLTSPGPVIYSQTRIGRSHRPFRIYKFRSMRTDAEKNGPALSSDNDPRITPIGRILRKYRLDELPQFWNVIKGDMSLVGPRPEREHYIKEIVKSAPYYTLVHQVRPGITSWGMVKYGYASTVEEMVERTRYDLIYLANMSTMVDIKIMIYTLRTVFTGKGK